jgi:RES domain-containing protein
MLDNDKLDLALSQISPISIGYTGVRAVRSKYMKEPLSVKGSLIVGGRYNCPNYLLLKMGLPFAGALYIARDIETAMAETGAVSEKSTKVSFRISYKLDNVLDLTDQENLDILHTSYQELTGNWREMNEECQISPTQRLGLAVQRSTNFSASKSRSAKTKIGNIYNIVIFIDEANEATTVKQNGISLKAEIINE